MGHPERLGRGKAGWTVSWARTAGDPVPAATGRHQATDAGDVLRLVRTSWVLNQAQGRQAVIGACSVAAFKARACYLNSAIRNALSDGSLARALTTPEPTHYWQLSTHRRFLRTCVTHACPAHLPLYDRLGPSCKHGYSMVPQSL